MESKEKNTNGAAAWQEAVLSLVAGAAGCLGFILICCEPADDGSPFTWQFFAVKAAGFAILIGLSLLFKWMDKRHGGHGDDGRA